MKFIKLLPFALAAALIITLCSSTYAMYKLNTSMDATLQAKTYSFLVNGSSSENMSLNVNAAIGPGEVYEIPVNLSAVRSDVPVNAYVTLTAHPTGDIPPGFSVWLDDVVARGAQTLTANMAYAGLQSIDTTAIIYVRWDDPGAIDYQAYADFAVSLSLLVESEQQL